MKEELTIQEFQELGTEMLREVVTICEEEGIKYYAMFGTLLGAVRHQGPIPWDNDIDLCVPVEEMERFVSVMKQKLPTKYWLDYRDNIKSLRYFPRVGLYGYYTESFHIDFYPLAGMPDNISKSKRVRKYGKFLFVLLRAKTQKNNSKNKTKFRTIVSKATKVLTFLVPTKLIVEAVDNLLKKYPVSGKNKVALAYSKNEYPYEVFGEGAFLQYCDYKIRVPAEYKVFLERQYGDYMKYPSQEHINKMMNRTYHLIPRK